MTCWTTMPTAVGSLRLTTDGTGITGIEFEPHPPCAGAREDDHPLLRQAVTQLAEYFAGTRTDFDLPLSPAGTAFQHKVWEALRGIPYGATATYGEVARRIGLDPATTSRAVGAANGRNPIPVVVPCHRVIGADGRLTGFRGGLDRKRTLLRLEAGTLPPGLPLG